MQTLNQGRTLNVPP